MTQKGEMTHGAILQAARSLFYERGYTATYCADIAREAGINPGLIHYHFKNKAEIALSAYNELLVSSKEAIHSLFPDESRLVETAVHSRLYWRFIIGSFEFRRFLHEISLERIPLEISEMEGHDYFEEIWQSLEIERRPLMDDGMLRLLSRCSISAETEILDDFMRGSSELDEDTMTMLDLNILCRLTYVPDDMTDHALERARTLCENIDATVLPGLEPRIRRKG